MLFIYRNTRVSDISLYTDGSKTATGVGSGLLLPGGRMLSERMNSQCSVFQAELNALDMAANYALTQTGKTITVYSDSMSSLQAFDSNSHKSYTAATTLNKWNQVARNNSVSMNWVKAHNGNPGNEAADDAAKLGTLNSCRAVSEVLPPASRDKLLLRRALLYEWELYWRKYPKKYEQTRHWFKAPSVDKTVQLLLLPRHKLRLAVLAITGFNKLARHISKWDTTISPECRLCDCPREDFIHLVIECPRTRVRAWANLANFLTDREWEACELLEFISWEPITAMLDE
jgi:ribonuclease HI